MSISDLHLWLQQFFLQKTCFHGVSSRNYLILKTNETNQGHNIRSLVLNRGANWTIFVLDRVRVWWPRRYIRFLSILAPLPPGAPSGAVARLLWTRPFLPTFVAIFTAHIVQKTTSIWVQTTKTLKEAYLDSFSDGQSSNRRYFNFI